MLSYSIHRFIPVLLVCLIIGLAIVAFKGSSTPSLLSSLDLGMQSQMQTMADQEGISAEAAAYKYGWQNDMALMVDRIREASPNSVNTAEVTGDRSGRIDFAGDEPSSAQSEVSAFQSLHPGVNVEIRTNRGYSEGDLDNALMAIHYALLEQDTVQNVITYFEDGVITSRVLLSEFSSPGTLGGLSDLAEGKLIQDKANMTDYIRVVVEEMESAAELSTSEVK